MFECHYHERVEEVSTEVVVTKGKGKVKVEHFVYILYSTQRQREREIEGVERMRRLPDLNLREQYRGEVVINN